MLILAYFIIYTIIFLFGITIGSFLNVIIFRVPKGEFLKRNRSYCPQCGELIAYYDLIPVLSYLILGGKCRNCKEKISPRYPLVELATGLVALLCHWQFSMTLKFLCVFTVGAIFICITFIDIEHMEIPDSLVLALAVPAIVSVFLFPEGLTSRIIGMYIVSVPMLLITLLIPTAFGGGDIKLIAVCGFLLGMSNVLLATFVALMTAGIRASWLLLTRKSNTETHICFGPYICLGVYVSLFWGEALINWYLGFF